MNTCTKWSDIGSHEGGACKHYNKTVSLGTCQHCPLNDGGSKWLAFRKKHKVGTKIAKATSAVGIKPCGGCKKRKAYLDGDIT